MLSFTSDVRFLKLSNNCVPVKNNLIIFFVLWHFLTGFAVVSCLIN